MENGAARGTRSRSVIDRQCVDARGVLGVRLHLLLQFSQVPFRQRRIRPLGNLREDPINLRLQLTSEVFLAFDLLTHGLGDNGPEHRDQMILGEVSAIFIFQRYPLL